MFLILCQSSDWAPTFSAYPHLLQPTPLSPLPCSEVQLEWSVAIQGVGSVDACLISNPILQAWLPNKTQTVSDPYCYPQSAWRNPTLNTSWSSPWTRLYPFTSDTSFLFYIPAGGAATWFSLRVAWSPWNATSYTKPLQIPIGHPSSNTLATTPLFSLLM